MFDEAIEFIAPCEVPSSAIEPQSAVLLIEPSQREQFRKQLLRLNKKTKTFGLPAIKVLKETQVLYERVSEHIGRSDAVISYLQPLKPGKHPAHPVRLLRLEIHYPEIKLGNWQVVGKLESMEGGNLQFHVTEGKADAQAIAAYAVLRLLMLLLDKWAEQGWIAMPSVFYLCLYIILLGCGHWLCAAVL